MATADGIVKLTNRDKMFYPTMGPFLSRREIVGEIGYPIWDDADKTWYVSFEGGKVAGFAALVEHKDHTSLASAYVLPTCRGRGVYGSLLDSRLSAVVVWPATATATAASLPALTRRGFTVIGARGRYTKVKKETSHV